MERFLCLDYGHVGPLDIRGNCATCGSSAVVSEHAHGYEPEPFPGYRAWLAGAEKVLKTYELKRIERNEVLELERMWLR